MHVRVTQDVPLQRISDLLCCALEGGSNYWYFIQEMDEPPKLEFRSHETKVFKHLDYPLNDGGALSIASNEEPERKHAILNLESIRKGLQIMAEKYPNHFGDFIAENEDATTGDVFLQCACYGEVLYG
jgi:hypothetical protein